MKWNHIMDCQPDDDKDIVQVDPPYIDGHRTIGMRKYAQKCTFEEVLKYSAESGLPNPDFWWVYAEDFPFPKNKTKKQQILEECEELGHVWTWMPKDHRACMRCGAYQ